MLGGDETECVIQISDIECTECGHIYRFVAGEKPRWDLSGRGVQLFIKQDKRSVS